jgi:hypothetical protein
MLGPGKVMVSVLVWASIKTYHRFGASTTEIYFSQFGVWKFKIKVLTWLVLEEGGVYFWLTGEAASWYFHIMERVSSGMSFFFIMALIPSLPKLMTSSNLNYPQSSS